MIALTARQSEALAFIADFREMYGVSPSYRQIAKGLGLASPGRVHDIVNALEERAAIRRLANRHRSIEVIEFQDAEFHLRAILASFSPNGILFVEDRAVVAAKEYLGRRSS